MGSSTFLIVDGQHISLSQALQYLQGASKLDGFIGAILRQYVVERELQTRTDLAINSAAVDQIASEFRLQNQLVTPEQFQEWLASQGIDNQQFRQQLSQNLRFNQLKATVSQPRLQEYFIERKLSLDQVVLSRIAVNSKELADELKQQIIEGARFEQLAQEYSMTDDRLFNGMMGLVGRGDLPDALRSALDLAKPGDIIGPMEVEDFWTLFRFEHPLPASLDNPQLQESLQNELFEQWIVEKLQQMNIQVQLEDEPT